MSARNMKLFRGAIISLLLLMVQPAWAEYGLNLPRGDPAES